tara:strand:+ start:141 stop:494 length:354 start_codon:yes stop_codon:yes gene_type:complete
MKKLLLLSLLIIGCSSQPLPKDIHVLDEVSNETLNKWAVEIDTLFDISKGYLQGFSEFRGYVDENNLDSYKENFPTITWERAYQYSKALLIDKKPYEEVAKEFELLEQFINRMFDLQ